MPNPTPTSKSWLDFAFNVATRLGSRMRDEWKAGETEARESEAPLDYEAAPPKKPAPAPQPQWWEILQVPRTATEEEIKRAYRRLIKESHPDRAGHLSPEDQAANEREAKRLNDAYERALAQV